MPMHDWKRVQAGIYHNFHTLWMAGITNALNTGLLPPGYYAMAEQIIGQPEADVVALKSPRGNGLHTRGGVAVLPKPNTRFVLKLTTEAARYASRTHRVVVRHSLGDVVAVIEIVSPGNKDRKHALEAFVQKAINLLRQQVNLLIVDPFPPGKHDPESIARPICEEFGDESFTPSKAQPLLAAAFEAEPPLSAYLETFAVGEPLPGMPLFLSGESYVTLPLEETYQSTWNVLPQELRRLVEHPEAA